MSLFSALPLALGYLVRVKYTRAGKLPTAEMNRLQHGLSLDGKPLKPAKVWWQNDDQLRFVLREGKKVEIPVILQPGA